MENILNYIIMILGGIALLVFIIGYSVLLFSADYIEVADGVWVAVKQDKD